MNTTIAVDFDNVISDLLPAWLKWLNKVHNLNLKVNDIKHYDMTKSIPELAPELIYAPLHSTLFWQTVPAVKGSLATLKKLYNAGYEVIIVTNTSLKTLIPKYDACIRRLLQDIIPEKNIIITERKDLIHCDYLIDDYEENLSKSGATRILVDYPYNKNANRNCYDIRVKSLSDFYKYLYND